MCTIACETMAKKKLFLAVVALYLAYRFGTKSVTPGEVVETELGKVQGIQLLSRDGREFYEWRGIPFAEPPVGELRYQTPRPATKWAGIRDGSSYGSICAQFDMFLTKKPMGAEDCLHLNIASPKRKFHEARSGKGLLPVMVWIYGGYFTVGSGSEYPATYFMDEDVVLVTLNYRLGALGFLSTQDENARGNMGLKDQALALKWVKDNIHAFGGNPDSITVFGESAGGISVHHHILNSKNKGIIARAISQSGTAVNNFAINHDPVGQAKHYAKNVGCPTETNKELVDCLKTKDVNDLLWGHKPMGGPDKQKHDTFVPIIEKIDDGEAYITKSVKDIHASGGGLSVPWMTGTTTDEILFFMSNFVRNETNVLRALHDFNFLEQVFLIFTDHDPVLTSKIRQFYFGHQDPVDMREIENQLAVIKASSDWNFLAPNHEAIQLHANEQRPVYPFLYAKQGPSLVELLETFKGEYPVFIEIGIYIAKQLWHLLVPKPEPLLKGAAHTDELFMLFDMFHSVFTIQKGSPHYEFSKKMVRSWVQFASGKHPEIDGVKFPVVRTSKDVKYMWLDERSKVTEFPYTDRYAFWKKTGLL